MNIIGNNNWDFIL